MESPSPTKRRLNDHLKASLATHILNLGGIEKAKWVVIRLAFGAELETTQKQLKNLFFAWKNGKTTSFTDVVESLSPGSPFPISISSSTMIESRLKAFLPVSFDANRIGKWQTICIFNPILF